jgi:flagellar basal body rod protein FlgC
MSSISSTYSIAGNGLSAVSNQLASTAAKIASPNGLDNLVQNAVDLNTEKTSFKADTLLLRTANQMTGTLLDILDTAPRPG